MADDLYFIRAATGQVKIGRRNNVERRFAALRLMSPVELEIVCVVAGAGDDEQTWHAAFHDHRLHGEWFRTSEHLERAIAVAVTGGDWRPAFAANIDRAFRPERLPPPTIKRAAKYRPPSFTERRRARLAERSPNPIHNQDIPNGR